MQNASILTVENSISQRVLFITLISIRFRILDRLAWAM